MSSPSRIRVLVNPRAGQPEPVLRTLAEALGGHQVEWQADVIGADESIDLLVTRALDWGAERVAVYGGDGTVSSVAQALAGDSASIVILPGGTGNVIAAELGLPSELELACQLLTGPADLRQVDLGRVGDRMFVLRVGVGLEADMVARANPDLKARLGPLAYGLAALSALQERRRSRFRLEIDGKHIEAEAVTCVIANSANLGRPRLTLAPDIRIDDGVLDVILLRDADLEAIADVLRAARGDPVNTDSIKRWKGKRIRVEASPDREVQVDGETGMSLPLEIEVVPAALRVVVPQTDGNGGS